LSRLTAGILFGIFLLLVGNPARADVLFGECSKEGARISTSWNSKDAYVRDGKYRIEFDGRVNAYMTVYVNGKTYKRIKVDRATRLDIDPKK
jgi:hypothetical protein